MPSRRSPIPWSTRRSRSRRSPAVRGHRRLLHDRDRLGRLTVQLWLRRPLWSIGDVVRPPSWRRGSRAVEKVGRGRCVRNDRIEEVCHSNQGCVLDWLFESKLRCGTLKSFFNTIDPERTSAAFYSITASVIASRFGGMGRPSNLAVCRLMTSSYLIGCSTGRSAGFSPLSTRPV
jgi:hypothetical protein